MAHPFHLNDSVVPDFLFFSFTSFKLGWTGACFFAALSSAVPNHC